MNAKRSTLLTAAILATGLCQAVSAGADEKTVIKETPGKYSEAHEGNDGQYKYKSNGVNEKSAYEGHGVQAKESSNGVTTKKVYQDKDCQQKSVSNAATGESKTVAEGNCAP